MYHTRVATADAETARLLQMERMMALFDLAEELGLGHLFTE